MSVLADTTVVILAGGLGTRLRERVDDRPKVLAVINGRPFLEYLFDQVCTAGCARIVLCTGYKGDMIRQLFGNSYRGIPLAYSQEAEPLGTGGALRLAEPLLQSDPVLVSNGDSYLASDLPAFFSFWQQKKAKAALLLTHLAQTQRFGRVRLDENNRVTGFEEKGGTGEAGWINGGIYLIAREWVQRIPARGQVSLERDVFPGWIGGPFYGHCAQGEFIDIGTPESYDAAATFFRELSSRSV